MYGDIFIYKVHDFSYIRIEYMLIYKYIYVRYIYIGIYFVYKEKAERNTLNLIIVPWF